MSTASVVRFNKPDFSYQSRIKIAELPSPIKDGSALDSFADMVPEMQSTGRRSERLSVLETFNRQHTKSSKLPEERRIYFTTNFKSRRITEPIMKPWKDEKDPRVVAICIIPLLGIALGFMIGAYLVYAGYRGVPKHNFCPVLNEDWSNGIDPNTWTREVNLGGFGTGEFEWTTDSDSNAFVQNGKLHIRPTLTSDTLGVAAVTNGYTVDLTADGSCTGTTAAECIAVSNATESTILPPVQSARLISKGKFSMKYGKVEIKARMPRGDWLWPAIWMLPEDSVYGPWPMSGEIDIAEGRGNGRSYKSGGRNVISSTLHWGPSSVLDGFWRTNNGNEQFHSDYTGEFFTYGLEWTDKYLYTYINNHLRQVFYIKFDEPFFTRGQWPAIDKTNKTAIANPWAGAHNNVAPFDQEFYLILNVAVGTSFGFFPDGVGNKPWVDGTATAKQDFYSALDTWYPTWGSGDHRDMVVESVKAWKLC
ncbi:Putative uncharacterized protein [Taphrina deformans PYCC 5710]|uniref:GH16 domain-containing protein n=1 Tax=Taphrina deformans (strain PYCC 5710 / ATCC 11124 / CBS 356.35 / IMI 108563 / JCM 9778 / NBRC 8474) TaxID=1097556 RepID=R4XAW0_TAPDE|nr:Putative uncharacterized protein [Taphrina deformans PYCC 5710]|eukprot:CCG82958.1 Putative uncharacterized protein [Taphrina deformans PYCC 5710]